MVLVSSKRNVFAAGVEWKHDQYIIFLCALLYPPPEGHHSLVQWRKITIIVLNTAAVVFFHLKEEKDIIILISQKQDPSLTPEEKQLLRQWMQPDRVSPHLLSWQNIIGETPSQIPS